MTSRKKLCQEKKQVLLRDTGEKTGPKCGTEFTANFGIGTDLHTRLPRKYRYRTYLAKFLFTCTSDILFCWSLTQDICFHPT